MFAAKQGFYPPTMAGGGPGPGPGPGVGFAAVKPTTYMIYSQNGESWTTLNLFPIFGITIQFYETAIGNGAIMMTQIDGSTIRIAYSTNNGQTWSVANPGSLFFGTNCRYLQGRFFVSGITSMDLVNWSRSIFFNAMEYFNGVFVALTNENIITSSDGINWTNRGPISWHINARVLTFSFIVITQSEIILFGVNNDHLGNRLLMSATSSDGVTWPSQISNGDGDYNAIRDAASGPTAYMLVLRQTSTGNIVIRVNGTSGSFIATLPAGFSTPSQVSYGNNRFVAVTGSGSVDTVIYSDDDGVNWNTITLLESGPYRGLSYGDGT